MIHKLITPPLRPANGHRATILIPLFILLLITLLQGQIAVEAQEPLEPATPPDSFNGLSLYADRCANCHGPGGEGDGEMAGDLPAPPRNFTDEEFRRGTVPAALFQTITEGRLDAGMPPFGPTSSNPIETADRWDLVATVFSLGTPPEVVENGRIIYEENCLACHGEDGRGDGPEAATATADPGDLASLRYWYSRSNEIVFTNLLDVAIVDHQNELDEDALWDVIDYMRTFSYVYADPQAASAPIESVVISGQVTNGTTNGVVTNGTISLRAFTPDLQEALSLTAPLDPGGRYMVEFSDADPDWVYLSNIDYDGLNFSSNPERLDRSDPKLDLPIVVYEKTEDPSGINIDQVHMLVDFVEDRVQVNEIYVLSNTQPVVFNGATGIAEEGTVELALPAGAENVEFQRSFGSFENFLPAPEIIATDRGYADTVVVRPGEGIMNILVSYDLPFAEGMTIAHPVFYETSNASVVLPDIGLEIGGDSWMTQGSRQMGNAGTILSFTHPGLSAGEAVSFSLQGSPSAAASVGGNAQGSDSTIAILIGGAVFLVAAGGAAYTLHSWRQAAQDEIEDRSDQVDRLLVTIASLDESYEAGAMDEATYRKRREELVTELASIWVPL